MIIISGVRSRYVTACSGVILIILSIIPKFSAIATMIPASVFGGATTVILLLLLLRDRHTDKIRRYDQNGQYDGCRNFSQCRADV